ncbi:MAG: radical SAM protein [Candidatus Omnitrophota bacterium]
MQNYSFCNICTEIVPAKHVTRDGRVFLQKDCPKCGTNEDLISTDAVLYQKKRDFMNDVEYKSCKLNCLECDHKRPDIVFIETTNACNMNCPICLNNIPSMGFKFEPRMEFFDKIFKHCATYEPKPYIQLFGGEPTMRKDLFDIIKLGKSYGLSMRVVTNGLKLADEEYCNKLADLGVMINIAFDGLNRDMYAKLRGHTDVLDIKLKALENLAKRQRGKVVIMSVVDKEFNKTDMPEFFKFSLKNLHIIRGIYFMPLIHMWKKETLDYNPERTTTEDIEHMVNDSIEGGKVEFIPLGSLVLKNLYNIFGIKKMPFVGVHPNCESITYLISDGEKFVSISSFLKTSMFDIAGDLRNLEKFIVNKYKGAKLGGLAKLGICLKAFGILRKHFNFGAVVGAKGFGAFRKWVKIIFKLLTGEKPKNIFRSDTKFKGILQILTLPFEDHKSAEAERLVMCTSSFMFLDPETDAMKIFPLCTWEKYKKPIMKKIADKYNV